MTCAIPTEYYGIRYRSKSEAMFAAMMHKADWRFEYEPSWWPGEKDEWSPDFSVICGAARGSAMSVILVEYKPSHPTATYLDRVRSSFLKWEPYVLINSTLMVMCGSVFPNQCERFTYHLHDDGESWKEYDGWWLGLDEPQRVREVLDLRFDLDQRRTP